MSPALCPATGKPVVSWVATRIADGEPVLETFSASVASKVNTAQYRVESTGAYLQRFNASVRA